MTDRAAQLRTLATSFYRELMRLADEMDNNVNRDATNYRPSFASDIPDIAAMEAVRDAAEDRRFLAQGGNWADAPDDPALDC